MKPRIRIWRSVWHCYLAGSGSFHLLCGLGSTPRAAFDDWLFLMNRDTEARADSCATT